jgi:hypothetical protein
MSDDERTVKPLSLSDDDTVRWHPKLVTFMAKETAGDRVTAVERLNGALGWFLSEAMKKGAFLLSR